MSSNAQVVLVTGANRGLGLEMCRQLAQAGFKVILTARQKAAVEAACSGLASEGLTVDKVVMDVTNAESVQAAVQTVTQRYPKLDILINNAGILPDDAWAATDVPLTLVQEVLDTNTLGPWRVTQAFLPLLRKSSNAQIINVSSGLGKLEDMEGGYPGYRVSKTALNAVTRMLASELASDGIRVNSICPGWVQTDMGGPAASRTPVESVQGFLGWLLSPQNKQTGQFLRDGKVLSW